ncbi:GFA family protein [Pseudoalteromonas sp. S16_S37]|uniref:GFA family protein n=1 Tax=Pseudoalteromonas sp. S16_S37 TaxID=2720228 RepID=UPI0016816F7E|nr:GFA family protein [Pseudoalteromonas sp. S16_S37]MBD1584783.1 GFA family protein [Pseudoalteromonas sp. S16_S37]
MQGSCLCGAVEFSITGELPNLYQCHCSLCRKLSGSASDTATFLNAEQFSWVKGQAFIKSFKLPSGYRSDFCSACGSTVPHFMENGRQYWIPAGLLDGVCDTKVSVHLYVGSKASWDCINGDAQQYEQMPTMDELNKKLQSKQ